mgnify:CR=1 FL=1
MEGSVAHKVTAELSADNDEAYSPTPGFPLADDNDKDGIQSPAGQKPVGNKPESGSAIENIGSQITAISPSAEMQEEPYSLTPCDDSECRSSVDQPETGFTAEGSRDTSTPEAEDVSKIRAEDTTVMAKDQHSEPSAEVDEPYSPTPAGIVDSKPAGDEPTTYTPTPISPEKLDETTGNETDHPSKASAPAEVQVDEPYSPTTADDVRSEPTDDDAVIYHPTPISPEETDKSTGKDAGNSSHGSASAAMQDEPYIPAPAGDFEASNKPAVESVVEVQEDLNAPKAEKLNDPDMLSNDEQSEPIAEADEPYSPTAAGGVSSKPADCEPAAYTPTPKSPEQLDQASAEETGNLNESSEPAEMRVNEPYSPTPADDHNSPHTDVASTLYSPTPIEPEEQHETTVTEAGNSSEASADAETKMREPYNPIVSDDIKPTDDEPVVYTPTPIETEQMGKTTTDESRHQSRDGAPVEMQVNEPYSPTPADDLNSKLSDEEPTAYTPTPIPPEQLGETTAVEAGCSSKTSAPAEMQVNEPYSPTQADQISVVKVNSEKQA